jgi:hypothetical protein
MIARLSLLAALLMLAACAAAVPGYSPPPLSENKSKFAKPLDSGDVGSDGRYRMSETEKAMDCKRLTGSMQITLSRLRDSYGAAQPSATSSMAQSTVAPMLGGSSFGSDRQAVYARERAKLDAYNGELASRSCPTLDIDAELARPVEPMKKY